MSDDELLVLVKRVDPQAVRLPPGIKAIAAEIEAVEREACATTVIEWARTWNCPQAVGAADAIRERSNAKLPGGREAD